VETIRKLVGRLMLSKGSFEFFQRLGIHVVPNHFYSPVPDTREQARRRDLWDTDSELAGVDLNLPGQMEFLDTVVRSRRQECDFPVEKTATPHEYYVKNGAYGLLSAAVLHCMIRHHRPRTIIEVGSGNSTYVSARACLMNQAEGCATRLLSIEPYPAPTLQRGFPGLSELIAMEAQTAPLETYRQLRAGDILFIDSSHVMRLGNDVLFLYLEVLPRLEKGVVVHIHDIFFPRHYPEDWVLKQRRFWTEQYILQSFLMFNRSFEVLWSGSYMHARHLARLREVLPPSAGLAGQENYFSSSFWMRRIG
jgi:methyltransferase family protein